MDLDRWKQLDSLLQSVMERPLEERDAFLRHACAGDELLERQVRALLSAEPQAKNFLERPAIDLAALSLAPDQTGSTPDRTDLSVGACLGPYRVESKLGEGGMGEVYRAVDTRLGRSVAVKIAQQQFIQRFGQEARAISSLNHPHICTLYDVGPNYLVMELVE